MMSRYPSINFITIGSLEQEQANLDQGLFLLFNNTIFELLGQFDMLIKNAKLATKKGKKSKFYFCFNQYIAWRYQKSKKKISKKVHMTTKCKGGHSLKLYVSAHRTDIKIVNRYFATLLPKEAIGTPFFQKKYFGYFKNIS